MKDLRSVGLNAGLERLGTGAWQFWDRRVGPSRERPVYWLRRLCWMESLRRCLGAARSLEELEPHTFDRCKLKHVLLNAGRETIQQMCFEDSGPER